MRQPAKPLTVTPAVIPPPLPSDIAAGLVVEWHQHHAAWDIVVANVQGFGLEAHHDGYWEMVDPVDSANSTNGCCTGGVEDAKRAAVLALAEHLHEQLVKALDVVGSAAGADFVVGEDRTVIVEVNGKPNTSAGVTVTVEVPRLTKGMRVRCIKSPTHRTIHLGAEGTVDVAFANCNGGRVDFDGYDFPTTTLCLADEIEPVTAPSSEWVHSEAPEWTVANPNKPGCSRMLVSTLFDRVACGHHWVVWGENPRRDVYPATGFWEGFAPTIDEAKRAAEAAWIAAQK